MVPGPAEVHRDIQDARGGSVGSGRRRGVSDCLLRRPGQEGVRH